MTHREESPNFLEGNWFWRVAPHITQKQDLFDRCPCMRKESDFRHQNPFLACCKTLLRADCTEAQRMGREAYPFAGQSSAHDSSVHESAPLYEYFQTLEYAETVE